MVISSVPKKVQEIHTVGQWGKRMCSDEPFRWKVLKV